MRTSARCLLSLALSATSALTCASEFLPDKLHRVQAYDGPARPRSEVAILFAMDGRPRNESATFCAIDGFSLERDGQCASVVHVLPGVHHVKLRYRSNTQFGSGEMRFETAANRLYQINFSSLRIDYAAKVSVIPMYAGAKLSWRNLAPGLASGSPRIDEEVPYEPNAERGGPVQKRVVSDTDRPTVDRLLSCAGNFATDIELRKFDNREYSSRYDFVGAFIKASLSYLDEDDARSEQHLAQRKAMVTHALAFVAPDVATEDSTRARAQLDADLKACAEFYEANRTGSSSEPPGR